MGPPAPHPSLAPARHLRTGGFVVACASSIGIAMALMGVAGGWSAVPITVLEALVLGLGCAAVHRGRFGRGLFVGGAVVAGLMAVPALGGLAGPGVSLWIAQVGAVAVGLGTRPALLVVGAGGAVLALTAGGDAAVASVDPSLTLGGAVLAAALVAGLVGQAVERMESMVEALAGAERQTRLALADRDREIERRAAIESRMEAALVQARQANRAKSQFLASMSHELRTPLNAIIGYAEILEEEVRPGSPMAADLARIRHAGDHLLRLINDVLDLSKIEAGRMTLEPEEVDLDALIREVAETVLPTVERRGNRLDLDAEELGTAFLDGMRLRQVLLNLLSNAAKFTENGRIVVEARREDDGGQAWLCFAVRDTGIGIAPEQHERVFQPFSQAERSTSRRYGGTGLGLALCKRFVEMMEGTIELESAPGAGTTVRLRLPTRTEALAFEKLRRRRLEEARTLPDGRTIVLCIDDEIDALMLLDRTLREEGFHAVPCRDPLRAVGLARQLRPAVITLDLHMPNLDGAEVLRRLKQEPELASIPVVVVSVDGAAPTVMEGASAWLRKPIDRATLLQTITAVGRDGAAPVLVVDDDPSTRDLLVRMLDADGIRAVEASDGREALARLEQFEPRLVLLDLRMPVMDGFAVAEALRDDPRWSSLPVVVLTGADLDDASRRRLAHCRSILNKDEETLRHLVERLRQVA